MSQPQQPIQNQFHISNEANEGREGIFPFLSLPRELRDMIYELCLCFFYTFLPDQPAWYRHDTVVQLLAVSQQVNYEAAKVFYGRNLFLLGNTRGIKFKCDLFQWSPYTSDRIRRLHIDIRFSNGSNCEWEDRLARYLPHFKSLEHLSLGLLVVPPKPLREWETRAEMTFTDFVIQSRLPGVVSRILSCIPLKVTVECVNSPSLIRYRGRRIATWRFSPVVADRREKQEQYARIAQESKVGFESTKPSENRRIEHGLEGTNPGISSSNSGLATSLGNNTGLVTDNENIIEGGKKAAESVFPGLNTNYQWTISMFR